MATDGQSPVDEAPAPDRADVATPQASVPAEHQPPQADEAPVVTLPTIAETPGAVADTASDTTESAREPDVATADSEASGRPSTEDERSVPAATSPDQAATMEQAAPTTARDPAHPALSDLEARLQGLSVATTRVDDHRVKANLEHSVTFAARSTQLDSASKSFLGRLADALRDMTGVHLAVIAHTDSSGSDAFNRALSERRADAVANYIISRGIATDRVTHEGKGKSELKADREQEKSIGAWINRRIEIDFTTIEANDDQPAR